MRFSIEVNWTLLRRACSRLTSRVCSLANWWRGCQSMVSPAPVTISSAFGVSRWQWMSMVNHLPRAWIGPGNRPGIGAPSGRHLNSIGNFLPRLFYLSRSGCHLQQPAEAGDAVFAADRTQRRPDRRLVGGDDGLFELALP